MRGLRPIPGRMRNVGATCCLRWHRAALLLAPHYTTRMTQHVDAVQDIAAVTRHQRGRSNPTVEDVSSCATKTGEGGTMLCQRCSGLLVREAFDDLRVETGRICMAIRCINCGYIGDAVVRENRLHPLTPKRAVPHRGTRKTSGVFARSHAERSGSVEQSTHR